MVTFLWLERFSSTQRLLITQPHRARNLPQETCTNSDTVKKVTKSTQLARQQSSIASCSSAHIAIDHTYQFTPINTPMAKKTGTFIKFIHFRVKFAIRLATRPMIHYSLCQANHSFFECATRICPIGFFVAWNTAQKSGVWIAMTKSLLRRHAALLCHLLRKWNHRQSRQRSMLCSRTTEHSLPTEFGLPNALLLCCLLCSVLLLFRCPACFYLGVAYTGALHIWGG